MDSYLEPRGKSEKMIGANERKERDKSGKKPFIKQRTKEKI